MEPAPEPLVELIRKWFDYDPIRGVLIRKLKLRSDAHDEIDPTTRLSIHFQGKWYSYAVLCWIVHYKKFPDGWVDHKDRIKGHNWITNLREATPTQNQQNKAGSGQYAKGVTWRDRIEKPWQAKIRVNGVRIHLGSFAEHDEAAEAYRKAAKEHHGEFACVD